MLKVLVPVILLAIVAIVVLVIHRRESKVSELKTLRKQVNEYETLVEGLDKAAYAEYTVTNNLFAGSVLDAIRRHNIKEIA